MDCIAEKAHDWKALTPLSRPHRPEHDGCSCSKADGHEHEHTNLQRLKGLGITPAHGAPKRSSTLCPAASPTRADGTGFVTGAMTIGSSFAGAQAPTCTCARGGPPQRWTTSVSTRSARACHTCRRSLPFWRPSHRYVGYVFLPHRLILPCTFPLQQPSRQPMHQQPAAAAAAAAEAEAEMAEAVPVVATMQNMVPVVQVEAATSRCPWNHCRLSLSCRQRHHQYLNQHSSGHKLRLYTQRHLHLHSRRRHGLLRCVRRHSQHLRRRRQSRRHGRDTRRHHSQHHRFGSTSLRTRSKQICEE